MNQTVADSDVVIRLQHVSKTYPLYERNVVDRFKDTFLPGKKKRFREFQALKDISLEVRRREILGIVGRNGAGKSTLLKIISGITQPTSGTVESHGRIVPLLELGGGFNPEYTGRENIYFYCSLQGMRKEEIDAVYDEILSFAELGDFIDVQLKKYSTGMRARLAFSVSVNIDPDILILDEVLSVGDELFKRKCFARMEEFFDSGKTILFVSHSAQSITNLCTRAVLLHTGELVFQGTAHDVIPRYRKLLTSNSSDTDAILKKIKRDNAIPKGKSFAQQASGEPVDSGPSNGKESFFVSTFVSKSVKVIKESDIDIYNIKLLNKTGQTVNHVLRGEDLTLQARVRFNDAAD